MDEVEPQSTSQDVAESSCPVDPASVSESQDEPVVRHGNDLNSPGKSKKPQQHVPLALRTLNDPVDRLRLARAKKLRELLKKEMYKEKVSVRLSSCLYLDFEVSLFILFFFEIFGMS